MSWTCPYCQHVQTPTSPKLETGYSHLDVSDNVHGHVGLTWNATGCSNALCKQFTLRMELREFVATAQGGPTFRPVRNVPPLFSWQLLPESMAKPWPDYIPQQIRDDYREACLIRDLSPKASATLSRRCLQGMIRDFGRVKPGNLHSEIGALADNVRDGTAPRNVSIDSIAALTSLRKLGNIGAHMEADVDLIIPVDAQEARALIGIIELLLDEWYVENHKRAARFANVAEIEAEKAKLIADGRAGMKALEAPKAAEE